MSGTIKIFLQIIFFSIFLLSLSNGYATTITIVRDGPSPYFDDRINAVIKELKQLSLAKENLKIRDLPKFNAQWQAEKISRVLKNALTDSQTDIIFASGFLVTEAAAKKGFDLNKPVVGGAVHDGQFMGLVHDNKGCSPKQNFTYIEMPKSILHDIDAFQKLINFKTLHFLADEKIIDISVHAKAYFKAIEKQKNIKIKIIKAKTSAKSVLDQLNDDIQAIYLTPLVRMSFQDTQTIIDKINQKKIPCFAMLGRPLVERGVLAGRLPELKERMSRRIALNLRQIIMGEQPEKLKVTMSLPSKLMLNMETAAKINFSPDFTTLISEAELIGQKSVAPGPGLTLEQAMTMACKTNINTAIQESAVQSSFQTAQKSKTYMRPQIYANSQYRQIDADRAESSMGMAVERTATMSVVLRQMIYDDKIFTGIKTADLNFKANLEKQKSVKLDAAYEAGKRFLQCLSAIAMHRIEKNNLNLTQKNLNLSKIRHDVGYSGPEEIFRWEAEEAHRKSAVISAFQLINLSFAALNQNLGTNQEMKWQVQDIDINQGDSYFLEGDFHVFVNNLASLNKFRKFSVKTALKNALELAVIDKQIQANKLILKQNKRRYYMPVVTASAGYTYNVDKSGKGAGLSLNIPGLNLPDPPNDHEWSMTLDLSLPIYEGGKRCTDIKKSLIEIKKLEQSKTKIKQLIEQQTLSCVFNLSRSWPNIFLSKKAADRARKNLELVQAMYAQGKASITTLIDAQNQQLIQEQNAALAVYKYLEDLIEYQRAISWFEYSKTPEQKAQMVTNLGQYINKKD